MPPFYSPLALNCLFPLALLYTVCCHFLLKPLLRFSRCKSVLEKESLLLEENDTILPNVDSSTKRPLAIVTGCNTGIGLQTAIGLMKRGYDVIFACRSRDKAMEAIQKANDTVAAAGGSGTAIWLCPLDLSSPKSVTAFGREFLNKYSQLHVLVNNAGINTSGPLSPQEYDGRVGSTTGRTRDLCFQTNFVGHYQLTRDLLPALRKARHSCGTKSSPQQEAGRIVTLASTMHHFCAPNIWESRSCGGMETFMTKAWWLESATYEAAAASPYCDSKLAAILFAMELNRRYGSGAVGRRDEAPLRAVAVNPGGVNSDIWRAFPKIVVDLFRLIFLTNEQGSSTSVVGAVGNFEKAKPDETIYLQPYWIPQNSLGSAPLGRRRYRTPFPLFEMLAPYVGYAVTDPRLPGRDGGVAAAGALWEASAELVGYSTD